jgi:hypothetical protein
MLGLQRSEGDLDRDLAAVLVQRVKLQANPHRPGMGSTEEASAVTGMLLA